MVCLDLENYQNSHKKEHSKTVGWKDQLEVLPCKNWRKINVWGTVLRGERKAATKTLPWQYVTLENIACNEYTEGAIPRYIPQKINIKTRIVGVHLHNWENQKCQQKIQYFFY